MRFATLPLYPAAMFPYLDLRRTVERLFSERFVIDDNKIRSIYTAMFYPPPDLPVPNWPPYEGNWPLPAAINPAAQPPAR